MIIPEKQNIEFKENTILEVKSGILIMESKIKNKKNIVGIINENVVITVSYTHLTLPTSPHV